MPVICPLFGFFACCEEFLMKNICKQKPYHNMTAIIGEKGGKMTRETEVKIKNLKREIETREYRISILTDRNEIDQAEVDRTIAADPAKACTF